MMKVDLSGKVALVTGAAQNIGEAIADVYAENGAVVVYTDLNLDKTEKAASKYPDCKAMVMNVADNKEVEMVIGKVVKEFGHLDILVNNAATFTIEHRVNIDEFPNEEWYRIVDVNLTGVYLTSKAAAKVMLERNSGRIINIASIAGLVPLRLQCAYVASKAGVVNLTKAMALELAPNGILVNGIAPGSILTDGTRKIFYGKDGEVNEKAKQMLAHIPVGRPGKCEDIAYAALYLASPESGYINGHILTVDGGWTAGYTREF